MPTPFEYLQSLNRLVHEPARLAILVALSACDKADFLFLLNVTGLTKGNLSSHLGKLADAGIVAIEKAFAGRTPVTYVSLTPAGEAALKEYWASLDEVRGHLKSLIPDRSS